MFIDTSGYPWVPTFEAAAADITAEFHSLGVEALQPWPERALYGQGWNTFGFHFLGHKLEENCLRAPKTAAALAAIPELISAGFSVLEPGTWIRPHVGYSHSLYVGHLGLIIPDDCALRVGAETRGWIPGRFLAFNDMIQHESWNRGAARRVVMLIEFLRPGRELKELTASPEVEAMLKSLAAR
jgi:ornithine lipid ester-linked acyl 2-hydroxylase